MIRLATSALPGEAQDRQRVLAEYFAFERPATATAVDGGWELDVRPLADPACWVDTGLAEGLRWLGAPADLTAVGDFVRDEGSFVLALNDAWGLWSAARWLSRGPLPESVVILHADDHRDLASPRLAVDRGGYVDLITGDGVRLNAPDEVAAAIRSGAVGMGSFMTPLVWGIPHVEFRHLRVGVPDASMAIRRATEPDSLLRPGAPRPAIELVHGSSRSTYTLTSSAAEWASISGDGPVLVHLDLDYLNNRYNADSDWRDRQGRHDPAPSETMVLLEALLDALAQPDVACRIADIFVGVSPGFFPAEDWATVIDTCRRRLPQLRAAA